MSAVARPLLWVAASSALLLAGFAALVLCMLLVGASSAGAEAPSLADRLMAVVYFRVVFVKGLLPQLVLALALWPLLLRWQPALGRGVPQQAAGLALAALAAYAVVAPLLLSVELPGWPALQMRSLGHHVGTALTSVAGVVAAAVAGRRLAYGRARAVAPAQADLQVSQTCS